MANAPIDQNGRQGLFALSSVDGVTLVPLYANPTSHRLLVDLAGGSGTVTSVSVVSANGFAGTVATATSTPAITLTTTITGLLKGNGTAISAATAGTDYVGTGAVTTSGLTMATNKILGRATAGTGAIEEIATTGTGSVVLSGSPALTTPSIAAIVVSGGTLTLPTGASDTLVGKATTDILTNKTFDTAGTGNVFKINGTQVSAKTGTGSMVLDTSPTLITPLLGTPTSGTLTNCTGLPIAGLVASTSTAIGVGSIELGAASDTTLSRSAAGVLAVEGVVIPSISSTNTLTNKRINPRLTTAASYTTDTGTSLDITNCDQFEITAQAGALLFNAPGGTPLGGQKLIIRIKDNGTSRALTYNAIFRAIGVTLPTATTISKTTYMGFIYNNTDTKWDCVAVATEA